MKLNYRHDVVLMLIAEAPSKLLTIRAGRTHARGNWYFNVTFSLRNRQDTSVRRVYSWAWLWRKSAPPPTAVLQDAWMNNKPGAFRMKNGQTWKEWQAARKQIH